MPNLEQKTEKQKMLINSLSNSSGISSEEEVAEVLNNIHIIDQIDNQPKIEESHRNKFKNKRNLKKNSENFIVDTSAIFDEQSIIKKQSKINAAPPQIPCFSSDSASQKCEKVQQQQQAAPGIPDIFKSNKLYVGNLSYELTQKEFKKIFKKYGSLKSAQLATNSTNGINKGFGFVEFKTVESACKAKQDMSSYILYGKQVRIQYCQQQQG